MDDRQAKIARENAEAEHLLLSPVRFLMTFLKVGFMVIVALGLIFVTQVGWIVNIGPRSEHARVVRADYLERQLKDYDQNDSIGNEWAIYDIDFRRQPAPSADLPPYQRFWDDSLPWNQANVWAHPENQSVKAFTTSWNLSGGMPGHGIAYCSAVAHPEYLTTFFDSSPDSWSKRGDDALDRKSARMQRDYETAALMTAALRSAIAQIKAHRPTIASPAYCAGTEAGAAVVLAHAPVVRVRYMAINPDSADTDPEHAMGQAEIMGMCLVSSCPADPKDIHWGTTLYADLFAANAPLTDVQMEAERAMLAMKTEAFWEQAARENGINDMDAVRVVHDNAMRDLSGEFLFADNGN